MKTLVSLIAITSMTLFACAADEGNGGGAADTDNNSRALRSAEATSEVITLSADFAQVGALSARSSIAEFDLKSYVDDIVGADCGQVELTGNTMTVDMTSCPGLSGTISVTFPDADCLDPNNPDPNCLGDLDVTVTTTLEVEGIEINGTFSNLITDDGCEADGSLEIDFAGDELDVDFDIEITEDTANGCELVNGTINVAANGETVSVVAEGLVDCGECPEAGRLSVEANGESVVIDFDDGTIDVTGANGESVDVDLSCDAAI